MYKDVLRNPSRPTCSKMTTLCHDFLNSSIFFERNLTHRENFKSSSNHAIVLSLLPRTRLCFISGQIDVREGTKLKLLERESLLHTAAVSTVLGDGRNLFVIIWLILPVVIHLS